MKTRETIDAIGFVAVVGVLSAGVAVLGVLQAAGAGVDYLVVKPFALGARTIKAKAPVATPKQRYERHLPQAA